MENKFKIKVKIEEVSHEQLVDIFACATYGNPAMDITREYEQFNNLIKETSVCCEDKYADIIIGGGKVVAWDMYAEAESLDDAYEDGCVATQYCKEEYSIGYDLDLEHILKGLGICATNYPDVWSEWISEEGDMFTAWNIMQCIMFGDIIYG